MDPDYVEMCNYLETDTPVNDIDANCELKQMKEIIPRMSIVTLDTENRLIVKDETTILIPQGMRKQMEGILQFSHTSADSMITQCKSKIFWPGMKQALQKLYDTCKQCQQHKASQATPHTQVSGEDI